MGIDDNLLNNQYLTVQVTLSWMLTSPHSKISHCKKYPAIPLIKTVNKSLIFTCLFIVALMVAWLQLVYVPRVTSRRRLVLGWRQLWRLPQYPQHLLQLPLPPITMVLLCSPKTDPEWFLDTCEQFALYITYLRTMFFWKHCLPPRGFFNYPDFLVNQLNLINLYGKEASFP